MNSHGQADEPFGVNQPAPGFGRRVFTRAARQWLFDCLDVPVHPDASEVFTKRSRIVAVRIDEPFEVETEHGVVSAKAGDWIATNHPDDGDPTGDVWPISAERMAATYAPVETVEAAAHAHGHDEGLEHYWTGRRFSINEIVGFLVNAFDVDTETARLRVQALAEAHPI